MIALAAALGASGCTASLDREWELIVEELASRELAVEATIPPEGAVGMGRTAPVYMLFTRPVTEAEEGEIGAMAFFELDREIEQLGEPVPDFDDQAVRFFPEQLSRNLDYRLTVDLPEEAGSFDRPATTDRPRGPSFELTAATGLALVQAGGEEADAAFVTDLFTDAQPLYVLRLEGLPTVGPVTLPATVDVGMAPGDRGPDVYDVKQSLGYQTWFPGVEVDADGAFEHTQPGVFLTLYIGGDSFDSPVLRFRDPVLSGTLTRDEDGAPTGIADFRLEGVIETRWIRRLAAGIRPWPQVASSLVLDVDTNDNGTPDSANFAFTAQPPVIEDRENIAD